MTVPGKIKTGVRYTTAINLISIVELISMSHVKLLDMGPSTGKQVVVISSRHPKTKNLQARMSCVTRVITRDVGVVSSHLKDRRDDSCHRYGHEGTTPQGCTKDSFDELSMNRSRGSQGTKDIYTTTRCVTDRRGEQNESIDREIATKKW